MLCQAMLGQIYIGMALEAEQMFSQIKRDLAMVV